MSKLSNFLKSAGVRQSEFAATLGISRGYMSELVSGAKAPSRALAIRISNETGGLVSVSSWDHNSLDANAPRARQGSSSQKSQGGERVAG